MSLKDIQRKLISKLDLIRSLFTKSKFSQDVNRGIGEAIPEDGGDQAVEEEVDGGVEDHAELRDAAQQQNPERNLEAILIQTLLELLDYENLDEINNDVQISVYQKE